MSCLGQPAVVPSMDTQVTAPGSPKPPQASSAREVGRLNMPCTYSRMNLHYLNLTEHSLLTGW